MLTIKGIFVFKALNGLAAKVSCCSGQVMAYFCASVFYQYKTSSSGQNEMYMHTEEAEGWSQDPIKRIYGKIT